MFGDLMQKMEDAKKMLDQKKKELASKTFVGENQGVQVECNGASQIVKIHIPQDIADEKDPELLEDVVINAANKALSQAKQEEESLLKQGAMDFLPNLGL